MSTDFGFGTDVGAGEVGQALAAGLVGALPVGLLLQFGSPEALRATGALVGSPTVAGGWATLVGLGVLFCLPFVGFVSGTVNQFVNRVIMVSRRSELLQKLLVPMLQVSALGVTLFALGLIYGVLVAAFGFALALPLWLTGVAGHAVPVPWLDPVGLLGWVSYGSVMGLVYGLLEER